MKDALELRAENAFLDGVLVAVDPSQRPSREKLEARLEGESSEPLVFYAFDQLYYEEWDLRPLSLLERKGDPSERSCRSSRASSSSITCTAGAKSFMP